MTHDNAPTKAIRRFDVFAEYTRQQRREKGFPEDEAKGYGIWLTKVVAARRFGQKSASDGKKPGTKDAHEAEPKFRSVGDEPANGRDLRPRHHRANGAAVLRGGLRAGDRRGPGRGEVLRDHPRHDPPRLETCRCRAGKAPHPPSVGLRAWDNRAGRDASEEGAVYETAEDLVTLRDLIERSYARAGEHLRSIFTPERRIPAEDLVALLPGVQVRSPAECVSQVIGRRPCRPAGPPAGTPRRRRCPDCGPSFRT